jgi:hypothetical protein
MARTIRIRYGGESMEKLIDTSVMSKKNAIVVGVAVTFFLGMAGLSVYGWVAWRIFNPFELFVEFLFAVVLIERAASRYQYKLGAKTLEITKTGLFGSSRIYTVAYKDVIGVYRYRAKLVGVIRFRRTYRLHSALDGRPVWTIAYSSAANGKKENCRIYFKPSETILVALEGVLPGKVKVSEEEVVSQNILTQRKEYGS